MPRQLRMSEPEKRRAAECALEPIRTPGAIQSHGVFIAVDALTWIITSVSENALEHFDKDVTDLLGAHLSVITGEGPLSHFRDVLDAATASANPALIAINGKAFDVVLNRSGASIFVEFEPSLVPVEAQATATIFAAIHRLALLTTAQQLWKEGAQEVHSITRFDRVMIYHFHADGHGEVVAEVAATDMAPYLGLHYPASDIPTQARELYLTKLSRVIANSSAETAVLVTTGGSSSTPATEIDLSLAELRSVSPRHLEFMRNMEQTSTMSFSLVRDGSLIGMITCAHRSPRRVSFVVRQGLEVLANQIALQLSSISALEALGKQLELRTIRSRVIEGLIDDADISGELLGGIASMLDLIPADGATVRLNGIVASVGAAPSESVQVLLMRELSNEQEGCAFVTDSMLLDHPNLAAIAPESAGVLIVPIGDDGDYIAWFRAETLQSVNWLGDLSDSNRPTPLSPRSSFEAWSRDVAGVSTPWNEFESEATELGRDIERVLFRRSESRLALVAQIDPLTGLSNRRRLLDRLDHAYAKYARGEELTVLFVDLDGFKAVNDSLGHAVGDSILIRTAEQLLASTRAQDTVARIGGDEFVIVCENTTVAQADILAQRVVDAVRVLLPGHLPGDAAFAITASVGIASADQAMDASDLLVQADAAMYRAKVAGRNAFSH